MLIKIIKNYENSKLQLFPLIIFKMYNETKNKFKSINIITIYDIIIVLSFTKINIILKTKCIYLFGSN